MRLLDLTLPAPAENIALDEALLLQADASGGEILRFWEWPQPAVILGSGCRLRDDVDLDACLADDVPIFRRSSGGGTVMLGRGCLVYSLVLAYDRDPALRTISSSYQYVLGTVGRALTALGLRASHAGTSDLSCDDRKFSGNSQQRKRKHFLHHGTLLYCFDIASIARYLRVPARQPDYRHGRGHADFLCNLPAEPEQIKSVIASAWGATLGDCDWPHEPVARLVRERFGSIEWTTRL